jgi:hypothetical protein
VVVIKISFLVYPSDKLDGDGLSIYDMYRELATRNVFVERTLEPSFIHPFQYTKGQKIIHRNISIEDRVRTLHTEAQ